MNETVDRRAPVRGLTLVSWLVALAWAAVIFYLSAQPGLKISEGLSDFILRKMAHMFVFGLLFLLLQNAIRRLGIRPARAMAACVLVALAYAASDEYHQSFVPQRGASVRDVGIDLAGILLALLLLWAWRRRRSRSGDNGPNPA